MTNFRKKIEARMNKKSDENKVYQMEGSNITFNLSEFIKDNNAPGVQPPTQQEIVELSNLKIGEIMHFPIGGGFMKVKRIS